MLFFFLYSMGQVELVGRHYFLELRQLRPSLYSVSLLRSFAPRQ